MLIPKQRGPHPSHPDRIRKLVFKRQFLTGILALSPSQVSKLFAPFYRPADVLLYLRTRGYQPPQQSTKRKKGEQTAEGKRIIVTHSESKVMI